MRSSFFILLIFACCGVLGAQDYSTPPLFNYACQIDSNCALYSRLGIHMQVDTEYYKGKLYRISTRNYNNRGQVYMAEDQYAEFPLYRYVVQYFYDTTGKCIRGIISTIHEHDTVYRAVKRVVSDDTASGYYSYEVTYWTPSTPQRDSTFHSLELDYISTGYRWGTTSYYPNRILVEGTSKGHGLPWKGMIYVLHDEDSLYSIYSEDQGVGSLATWNMKCFPDIHTRSLGKSYGGRYRETLTWTEGKLTEHHQFVDSCQGRDVRLTRIYNLLDSSKEAEVIIYRSDTLTLVLKNGVNVFMDYTPDSCKVDAPMPVPVPEFPDHSYYSSWRTETTLEDGTVRIDFYNPFQGTALPIYRIWEDKNGVALRLQELDTVVKRVTF